MQSNDSVADFLKPIHTFGQAAILANLSPKTLRGWLDRKQISILSEDDRPNGNWRRFSLVDVLLLAIIGVIVRYGFRVVDANEFVRSEVYERIRPLLKTGNINAGLASALHASTFHLRFGEGGRPIPFGPNLLRDGIGDYLTIRPIDISGDMIRRCETMRSSGVLEKILESDLNSES